ncbi:cytochrome P450 [Luteococcus sp. OSA5]|uniref:cytochrome P450 n=1 Tax=Luteococcus sp. OSA5 TaxID=3401630 RepID=UPI003B436CD0
MSTHADPRTEYDHQLNSGCPVQRQADGSWLVTGHAEAVAAATDPEAFSSAVSRFLQVPNGLDGDEHTRYRRVVDSFMTSQQVDDLQEDCQRIADQVVEGLPRGQRLDIVADLGAPFAVKTQCHWLGWPSRVEPLLVAWMADNQRATAARDDAALAEVAERFDAIVREQVAARRSGEHPDDVTGQLARATVETADGGQQPLDDAEVVSILRNWTAGDLGSLAICLGVLVHSLAVTPELQQELRGMAADLPARRDDFDRAIDELLRIDDPFLSNRRVTTRDVELGGQQLAAGERVVLAWTGANRDRRVFPDPDRYDPQGHAARNLVYGIGPHVCPGRALATMELRVALAALLRKTTSITLDGTGARNQAPLGGWAEVPVILA